MACLSCELACAKAFYKTEDTATQNLSCIQITSKDDKMSLPAASGGVLNPKAE
jgi:hypothetical protein